MRERGRELKVEFWSLFSVGEMPILGKVIFGRREDIQKVEISLHLAGHGPGG